MRSASRLRVGAVAALGAAALSLAGCSGHSRSPARPEAQLVLSPYERVAVADGAADLWSLRDATDLSTRDEVADLSHPASAAAVVGGTIATTTGPQGAVAAMFLRSGRLVTPVLSGLTSRDAFSVELDLRADLCVSAWGRVLGTTSLPSSGREGFEVLHFPKQFRINPCRFGVEFWHHGKHLGGCHPDAAPVVGAWTRWAIVYAAGRVTCYQNGRRIESTALAAPRRFDQLGPLGIGGSGSGFQGPLDGASVSEVALYRRALTPVAVLRHAGLSLVPAPRPTPTS